jgi:tape measure domain-containing protein
MNGLNLKLIVSLVDKITSPARRLRERFVASFKAMSEAVFKFGDKMDKMGKKITEAGGFLTTRLTAPIAGLGLLSLRTAGQNEQLALSLESIAGGAQAAQEYLKQLMAFNQGTPFALDDTVNAAANLRTAGYDIEQTNDRLKMLGEIAAKSKKSLTEMVGTYLDMRLAGKVGSSELSNLMKANVPIVEELSRMLGVSHQRVYQLADDGKISFKQMRDAMRSMTSEGGVLNGQMQKYGRSLFGMFDDLKRGISETMGAIGVQLYAQLEIADKIKRLTAFVRDLAEGFMKLPKPMQDFIVWTALIMAAIGPLVLIIGQIVIGIGLFSMGLGQLMPIMALAGKLFLGFGRVLLWMAGLIGAIPTLVVAFGVAGYMLVKHWDKVSAFFADMWTAIKSSFSTAIDWLMTKIESFLGVIEKIKGGFNSLKGLATDNALTRGWDRMFGDAQPQGAQAGAAPLPTGAMVGRQSMDAGGTVKIKIDSEGRVKKVDAKTNDSRVDYSVDTGLLMGGY